MLTDEDVSFTTDRAYAKRILITRGNLFLLMGFLTLNFLIWMGNKLPLEEIFFMAIATGLLLIGAVLTYVATYLSYYHKKKHNLSKEVYVCKYCGERFESERIKNRHERSCPKMKI